MILQEVLIHVFAGHVRRLVAGEAKASFEILIKQCQLPSGSLWW